VHHGVDEIDVPGLLDRLIGHGYGGREKWRTERSFDVGESSNPLRVVRTDGVDPHPDPERHPGCFHAREFDLAAQELQEIHRGRRPGHREPHLHILVVETKHEVPHRRSPGNEAIGSPGPELDGTVVGGDDAVE
jgi:hypothetical protein